MKYRMFLYAKCLVLILICLSSACGPITSNEASKSPTVSLNTAIAQLASTVHATQTYQAGLVALSTPSPGVILTTTASPGGVLIDPVNASALSVTAQITLENATSFSWMPENRIFAISSEQGITFFDYLSDARVLTIQTQNPKLLQVSSDLGLLAWISGDSEVHIWSQAENREFNTILEKDQVITGLSLGSNNRELAISTYSKVISIRDTFEGQELIRKELDYWLANLSYSPDGSQIGGVDLANFTVHIFDGTSAQELRSLSWDGGASPDLYGAYFSPDWQRIAWVARGTVQLMDANNGANGALLSHEDFVSAVAWSPNGRLLATAAAATVNGELNPVVSLWDTRDGSLINRLVQINGIANFMFSLDGKELAILDNRGKLSVWVVPG